jgi:hypothetical protein
MREILPGIFAWGSTYADRPWDLNGYAIRLDISSGKALGVGSALSHPCLSVGLFPVAHLTVSELILISENISSSGRHNTDTRTAILRIRYRNRASRAFGKAWPLALQKMRQV